MCQCYMKYRQIEAFNVFVLSGSTVRAAELMGITQPAVSRLLGDLEADLRFALFDRTRGRLVVTPEGRLFHREVEASFVGLDRLRAAAAAIRDHGEGRLRIGCLAAGGESLVPEAIRAFRLSHPGVRLTLHILWSSAVRDGVVDGRYDIGLAADEIDPSGLDSEPFGNLPGTIVMPRDHPLARLDEIRPEHLAGVTLIGLAPEDRARQRFDDILAAAGVEPAYVVDTPAAATVCRLALSGNAVGLTNPLVARGFEGTGLVFRPFEPRVDFRTLLLYPPGTGTSRLVRAFTRCLTAGRDEGDAMGKGE